MNLLALKAYLMQVKKINLTELRKQFKEVSPDLLRDMLSYWMRKGRVRCLMKTPFCGSKCTKCDLADIEVYEWVL